MRYEILECDSSLPICSSSNVVKIVQVCNKLFMPVDKWILQPHSMRIDFKVCELLLSEVNIASNSSDVIVFGKCMFKLTRLELVDKSWHNVGKSIVQKTEQFSSWVHWATTLSVTSWLTVTWRVMCFSCCKICGLMFEIMESRETWLNGWISVSLSHLLIIFTNWAPYSIQPVVKWQ